MSSPHHLLWLSVSRFPLFERTPDILGCCLVTKLCLTLRTQQTVAHQAPLSMGFPRQEFWSGLPFPSQGILSTQGLNLHLLHWQAESLPLSHPESCYIGLGLPLMTSSYLDHLQRPQFQIGSHFQVPGVMTSVSLLGGHNTAHGTFPNVGKCHSHFIIALPYSSLCTSFPASSPTLLHPLFTRHSTNIYAVVTVSSPLCPSLC